MCFDDYEIDEIKEEFKKYLVGFPLVTLGLGWLVLCIMLVVKVLEFIGRLLF